MLALVWNIVHLNSLQFYWALIFINLKLFCHRNLQCTDTMVFWFCFVVSEQIMFLVLYISSHWSVWFLHSTIILLFYTPIIEKGSLHLHTFYIHWGFWCAQCLSWYCRNSAFHTFAGISNAAQDSHLSALKSRQILKVPLVVLGTSVASRTSKTWEN